MDIEKFNSDFDRIMSEKPEFSKLFIRDLDAVWNAIAESASGFCDDNESAIEMCIDANRLQTFGSTESENELKKLIADHGFKAVIRELSKTVILV